MIESDVERVVVAFAENLGWTIRKMKWIGRRHAPDRFCAHPNHGVVLVEFKRPKNPSDRVMQDREIDRLRKAGVRVEKIYTIESGEALFV